MITLERNIRRTSADWTDEDICINKSRRGFYTRLRMIVADTADGELMYALVAGRKPLPVDVEATRR